MGAAGSPNGTILFRDLDKSPICLWNVPEARKKKPIDIYWVLSEADIPPDLEFVEDDSSPGHYFLTVTAPMRIEKLVEKLTMISHRMSVIKDGGRVL